MSDFSILHPGNSHLEITGNEDNPPTLRIRHPNGSFVDLTVDETGAIIFKNHDATKQSRIRKLCSSFARLVKKILSP